MIGRSFVPLRVKFGWQYAGPIFAVSAQVVFTPIVRLSDGDCRPFGYALALEPTHLYARGV